MPEDTSKIESVTQPRFIEFTVVPNEISQENSEIIVALLSVYPFTIFDQDTDPKAVKAYGETSEFPIETQKEIEALMFDFAEFFEWKETEIKNWNEEWEKNFFQPLSIGKFYVRAPFHPEKSDALTITIEPKMSFGTGHHSTTQLMLGALLAFEEHIANKKVLDMGTGTGILAIAAEMLGAQECLGIEIDDWVVDNALENVEKNFCKKTKIILGTAEQLKPISNEYYDITLANIHREVILADLPEYRRVTKKGGYIFISGLQLQDLDLVNDFAVNMNLKPIYKETHTEWGVLGYLKNDL
jgi:ribosomal protein L11 methyltransferase